MATEPIRFTVNGRPATGVAGTSVAVALMTGGTSAFRKSVSGEPRAPLCGMGICFECRVTIDGLRHQKSCQIPLAEGMTVVTDE